MALTRVTGEVIKDRTIQGQDIADGAVGLEKLDISGAQPGEAIVLTSGGALEFQTISADSLSDIDATGATVGEALVWNGTAWVPGTPSGTGPGSAVDTLDDLLDVSLTALSSGQTLKWNGSVWTNDAIEYSEIANAPFIPLNFGDLGDVTLTGPVANQIAVYNGSNWVNLDATKALISDFNDADYATAAQGLLADSALQGGENVSIFANDAGYLTVATAVSALGLEPVALSGSYNDLIDVPTEFTPTAHTHVKADISDFSDLDYATAAQGTLADSAIQPADNVSLLANDAGYLTSATAGGALGLATIATTGDYSDLINVPSTFAPSAHTHVKADITDFNDADYATSAQGLLADSAVQPGDLATVSTTGVYGDLSGIPGTFTPSAHTHVKADITDFSDADYATAIQGLKADTALQSGDVATVALSGSYTDLINQPTEFTPTAHTHVKADISDFNDLDYATAAQGALANTALQAGDNISELLNDIGYFSGVTINGGTLTAGHALMYTGTTWANRELVKADISDFSDSDYATAAQGLLADTAVQPGANVSDLSNDIGYLTGDSILQDLLDVVAPAPLAGQVLRWTGSEWVNSDDGLSSITLDSLADVDTSGSGAGQVLTFDGSGWVATSTTTISGEVNTASNIGPGVGIFSSKVSEDLEFKSILAGSGVSVTNYVDNITLALESDISGLNDVDTTGATNGQILRYNGAEWVASTENPTSGQANTASNRAGTGEGVFAAKVGVDLEFKRIRGTGNISITSDSNEIIIDTLSTVGESNEGVNLGAGTGLYAGKSGTDLQFYTLTNGSNVTITPVGNSVEIQSYNPLESVSNPLAGEGLIYNGSAWINRSLLKSDISDFSDGDYATAAQGALADSAAQPGDDISIFSNDTGYLTGSSILNDLLDVVAPAPVSGQILRWNGSEWFNSDEATDITASNVGDGENVFIQKNVNDLEFATIKAGSGIAININGTGALEIESTASGAGEANTASNLTGDEGIFAQKSGSDLQFKSLVAGTGVTLSSDANSITINSTGAGGGATVLDELGDVTMIDPGLGDVLFHNGSVWRDGTASEAGLATAAQGALADSALQNINSESINDLSDVDTTVGLDVNDVLTWDGANWIPGAPATGGIDWTIDQGGSAVIHPGNYTDTDTNRLQDLTDTASSPVANYFVRWNATATEAIYVELVKSMITDFSDGDYATAAQGALADTATQPGDAISSLSNDANYITIGDVPAAPVTSVNTQTGVVSLGLVDLDDIPTITGQAGKLLKVNPTEDGFVWGDPSGTTVSWGDISGTLSSQTDLQGALDAKEDSLPVPASVGLVLKSTGTVAGAYSWQTDDTGAGADGNDFVDGLTFDVGTGIITASVGTQPDQSTISLDGRYYTELEVDNALGLKEDSLGNPATTGFVLQSTDAGVRSWVDPSTFGSGEANQNAFSTVAVSGNGVTGTVNITADNSTDSFNLIAGTNVSFTESAGTNTLTINATAGGGGINNVVEDTTPQLGGALDVNGNAITSASDITLQPTGSLIVDGAGSASVTGGLNENLNVGTQGTGVLQLQGINWPTVGAGQDTQVLTYDHGTTSWILTTPTGGSGTVTSIATTGPITGGPITTSGTIGHDDSDGNKHVPANGTTNAGKVLTASGTAGTYTWETPAPAGDTNQNAFSNVALTGNVSGDTTIAADAPTDTITLVGGTNVTLTGNAGGDQITIDATGGGGGGAQTEDLVIRYTSGSGGTLNSGDVIVSTTSGITATVVDGPNSIVEISFTGYNLPPASIVAYGQNYSSNIWSIKGLGSLVASASQTVTDTGSSANPDILNGTTTCPPLRLQLRMSDTGSSAGFGQRAQALIRLVMLG